jgi:hypothetical protein
MTHQIPNAPSNKIKCSKPHHQQTLILKIQQPIKKLNWLKILKHWKSLIGGLFEYNFIQVFIYQCTSCHTFFTENSDTSDSNHEVSHQQAASVRIRLESIWMCEKLCQFTYCIMYLVNVFCIYWCNQCCPQHAVPAAGMLLRSVT